MNAHELLASLIADGARPFALIHRPNAEKGVVDILAGEGKTVATLADIPLPEAGAAQGPFRHEALVLVPHRQVTERGFAAVQDETPLYVLSILEQEKLGISDCLDLLPDEGIHLENAGFDISDDAYIKIVKDVLQNEIGKGEGANFVIRRAFTATLLDYSLNSALSLFRRLMLRETGAYWTFIVHTGDRTLVGATPERHVSLKHGQAVMNPISGTYRYPSEGPDIAGVLDFLENQKEAEELCMVLDEELKMMAQVCEGGGQVTGPYLREMAQLAHSEYYISGHCNKDPRDILRETLLAPTVTGSPLENACRVIAAYEPMGRGYYGGVAALIGRGGAEERSLDSAILIRTADFTAEQPNAHVMKIGVGATLVRHSDAESEVAETHGKVAGILRALSAGPTSSAPALRQPINAAHDPQVRNALASRNDRLSGFWLGGAQQSDNLGQGLTGQRVLVIDAEDNFTAMLSLQLESIGLKVDLLKHHAAMQPLDYDLVVLGPGPGDPRDRSEPRLVRMASILDQLLARRVPFLGVCLSHQLLCRRLGLDLRRRPSPNQGAQTEIDLFGTSRRVGFYNSFAAYHGHDLISPAGIGSVSLCRDRATGEVHGLRGTHFSSIQFHPESVLTESGPAILTELLTPIIAAKRELAS